MGVRRVAMVLNSPGLGGVPGVARALVARLPRDRYAPSVFLLKPGGPEGLKAIEDAGITPVVADPAGGKTAVIAQLADWLIATRIDILHTHSFRPNLYGRMAGAICRPNGLRIVSHYHNQYDGKWQADPHTRMLERHLAQVTDAMIAVSEAARDHIADVTDLPRDRIKVIENGVDLGSFAGASREEGRRRLELAQGDIAVGLVGRICRQKAQDVLVQAVRLLPDLHAVRFLAIGDEEDTTLAAALRQEIVQAGLQGRVRLTGHMADIAPVIAALDLLVMPSRWEGMPLVLLEAMAAGVPVIASKVGGIPEVAGESGAVCLLADNSPRTLAQAIQSLIHNPGSRTALAEAGHGRVAAYSWDKAADRLTEVYDSLFESVP